MKAKEAVAEIARSAEYTEYVKLAKLITNHPDEITSEIADKMLLLYKKILEIVGEAENSFIKQVRTSYSPTTPDGYKGASKNITNAQKAFERQVETQLPFYWGLSGTPSTDILTHEEG